MDKQYSPLQLFLGQNERNAGVSLLAVHFHFDLEPVWWCVEVVTTLVSVTAVAHEKRGKVNFRWEQP